MGPLLRAASESIAAEGPAIGLIEVQSIARGITVADAMVKRATVRLVLNRPVSPGKHLSLCTGDVGDVEEAMTAGLARAGSSLCDQLMLSQVHAEVLRALGSTERSTLDEALSIGILETFSAAAVLLGADAACKATDVHLYEIRLCDGLGGKGFAIFSGEQDLVEAALATAQEKLNPGLYLGHELIARPHPDLIESLLRN
jgi:microcompartment protein CcmL/EutN